MYAIFSRCNAKYCIIWLLLQIIYQQMVHFVNCTTAQIVAGFYGHSEISGQEYYPRRGHKKLTRKYLVTKRKMGKTGTSASSTNMAVFPANQRYISKKKRLDYIKFPVTVKVSFMTSSLCTDVKYQAPLSVKQISP